VSLSTIHRGASAALAALTIAALLVTACSPTSAGAPTPSDQPAPRQAPPGLACEAPAYPCTDAEVDPAVAERSHKLATDAAAQMLDGASFETAAAAIKAEPGIAEIAADSDSIRFRLEGGRPIWVLPKPDGAPTAEHPSPAGALRAPSQGATLAARPGAPRMAPLAAPRRIVGTDFNAKKAVVLAPYAFVQDGGGAGDDIAGILRRTRGYANNVTYLANETAQATNVQVNSFAHLAGNAAIFIDTPTGMICDDDRPDECHGVIAAQELADPEAYEEEFEEEGLERIVWREGGAAIGLNGYFFVTYYPNGIDDALIFLGGPDIDTPDLIESIIGSSSEIYWWDGKRDPAAAAEAMTSYVARLADTGRMTSSVYREMKSQLKIGDAQWNGATPKGSRIAMRIREVVTILDPATGQPLQNGATIAVDGELGDGQPDLVPFLVKVDGLSPGEEDHTTINVTIDDFSDLYLPSNDAEKVAENTWQVGQSFQHADLQEGQTLTIDAIAQLAEEDGISRQTLAFKVTGAKKKPDEAPPVPAETSPSAGRVEIGRVYEGTASAVTRLGYGDAKVTKVAKVRLVRDPNDGPGSKNVSFTVESGTMSWSLGGGNDGCSFSAPAAQVPIPASEFDALTISVPDDPNAPYRYFGSGSVEEGPSTTVSMNCDSVDVGYEQRAEGTWFYVARGDNLTTDGNTIEGADDKYEWSLHKVE
jgi:hypothetical protein